MDDPSPVRVVSVPGAFDEGGVGNCLGHFLGVVVGAGAFDLDGDKLGDPLAISDQSLRHAQHNVLNGGAHHLAFLAVALDRRHAALAVGENQDRIVGAHVAIDGDPVEGGFDAFEHAFLQAGLADVGVRGDETEHGCHVRADHTSPLGAGPDFHPVATDIQGDCDFLFTGVAGHDGACDILSVFFSQARDQVGEFGFDSSHGHGQANHSGGANGHLPLAKSQAFGDGFGCFAGVADPLDSGAGIGIAAVGHDGLDGVGLHVGLGDLDRGCFDAVGRKGPGGIARVGGVDQSKVESRIIGVFDAGADPAGMEPFGGADTPFDFFDGSSDRHSEPPAWLALEILQPGSFRKSTDEVEALHRLAAGSFAQIVFSAE